MRNFLNELTKIQETTFVDDKTYKATFVTSKAGTMVLRDLIRLYYIPSTVDLSDTHKMAFEEGRREVVLHILQKLITLKKEENNE